MRLALILTFSPWEKEQQGPSWELPDELAGTASQTRSYLVRPVGRGLGLRLGTEEEVDWGRFVVELLADLGYKYRI